MSAQRDVRHIAPPKFLFRLSRRHVSHREPEDERGVHDPRIDQVKQSEQRRRSVADRYHRPR